MPITLEPGANKHLPVHLTPLPPELATLYGKVTDADSPTVPVVGAVIQITGPGGTYSDTTDGNGDYEITGIEPGIYDGIVTHPDYEDYII